MDGEWKLHFQVKRSSAVIGLSARCQSAEFGSKGKMVICMRASLNQWGDEEGGVWWWAEPELDPRFCASGRFSETSTAADSKSVETNHPGCCYFNFKLFSDAFKGNNTR